MLFTVIEPLFWILLDAPETETPCVDEVIEPLLIVVVGVGPVIEIPG